MSLREKAVGINEEAFEIIKGKKESIGIMASYLHKDVRKSVLGFRLKIAELTENIGPNNLQYDFDVIFGDFSK